MKILIITPIWGRPEITHIWAKSLSMFITDNISVLCILSNDDPDVKDNTRKCIKPGFRICYFKNKPLGLKLNAGIEYALTHFEFDYIMNLGSDDIVHPALLQLYRESMQEKVDFFGLDKVYFYDTRVNKLLISIEYVWGAGRMISRKILEKLRNKGEFLYKSTENRGLDCNSMEKINNLLQIPYLQLKTGDFPYLVDIKTNESLNDILMMRNFTTEVDVDLLRRYYPTIITKMIYDHR